ncbi:aliphatic amidase expression-regulating protein [Abditibacteriota bacterium]|nr:aliphatic amidase expression-regulating protein [Abditibacteriota bacterium]
MYLNQKTPLLTERKLVEFLANRRSIGTMLALSCSVFAVGLSGCGNGGSDANTAANTATNAAANTATTSTDTSSGDKLDASVYDKADVKEVPVGILHSLTGTMAISETSVKDAEMMAITEINAKGGVMGKQIKPITEDGASDWDTFKTKAEKLITQDKAAAVFGCWTSVSRKTVLPVFEKYQGLLWYPVQYEGMETSPNIFYTGATTNQQITPAVEWLMKSMNKKKFFLIGSDYVFPRTANAEIKAQLKGAGLDPVGEEYTPLGHRDYATIVDKIKAAKPDIIFNSLNGDSNVEFFKQMKAVGMTAKDFPTMSVSIAEPEIAAIGPDVLAGHYAVWNYFQTTSTPQNKKFVADFIKANPKTPYTDDPMEAAYFGVYLWKAAVEKAKSFDVAKVRAASNGVSYMAPGGMVKIDGPTQHVYKTVRIGVVEPSGQFKEVWNSGQPVKPDPYLDGYAWAKGLKDKLKT